jgi:hypothetical protein
MAEKSSDFQPRDLDTGERLATTGRAVAQAIGYKTKGGHETQHGAELTVDEADAAAVIERWPEAQKKAAEQMIARYGAPNEATLTRLTWYRNGPWKRTEITSDAVVHNWPTVHTDFLTQTIDYRVPPSAAGAVIEFDGSIIIDRTRGEVSARCDSEAANVLGLNMVHEIVTGKRDAADARRISEQNTRRVQPGPGGPVRRAAPVRRPPGRNRGPGRELHRGGSHPTVCRQGQRRTGPPRRSNR